MTDTAARDGDLFKPGDLVNNTYTIEGVLGRGGTSTVYRARSEISGRLVAIKVLRAEFAGNVDFLSLLTREEEMREIRHPAVVRYSENHRTPEGHVYLLMDFVDGPGLDKLMKAGPQKVDDLLTICRRVASGLEAAHSHNIVHRDLSPDNIILKDGDPGQAVIIDFGIAKDTNPGAETIVGNEFAGKYAYAAPEQLAGKTDPRTDIYSLGALLLACFRGKKPDVGANPMEVLEKKGKPLDLAGVPEPLGSIVARMTHPDPAKRFQTAKQVIEAIDSGGAALPVDDTMEDDDRTVIAPIGAQTRDKAPKKPADTGGGGRLPLILGGLAAVAAIVVAALFFTGILGGGAPSYPPVSPYALLLDRDEAGPLSASGFVPSEEVQLALQSRAEQDGGFSQLTLASGEIGETWGQDVLSLLDILDPLDTFTLSLTDNTALITGTSAERGAADAVRSALAAGLPGVLEGTADIAYTPPFLPVDPLRAILAEFADCGPLTLVDPPATGYGPGATVAVGGTLASPATRTALNDTLIAAASPRPVSIQTEMLNETLCLIESYLPKAPPSGISFRFSEGSAPGQEMGDTFVVGENPVIDVILPADVTDGYLSVSFLDVSGNVFHLLPNRTRPDNSVAAMRAGQEGEVSVRLAYPEADASTERLAFRVDDSTLGKSKIMAIHATEPLFSALRPITESASGYAQALSDGQRNPDAQITALDTRILVTAEQ